MQFTEDYFHGFFDECDKSGIQDLNQISLLVKSALIKEVLSDPDILVGFQTEMQKVASVSFTIDELYDALYNSVLIKSADDEKKDEGGIWDTITHPEKWGDGISSAIGGLGFNGPDNKVDWDKVFHNPLVTGLIGGGIGSLLGGRGGMLLGGGAGLAAPYLYDSFTKKKPDEKPKETPAVTPKTPATDPAQSHTSNTFAKPVAEINQSVATTQSPSVSGGVNLDVAKANPLVNKPNTGLV